MPLHIAFVDWEGKPSQHPAYDEWNRLMELARDVAGKVDRVSGVLRVGRAALTDRGERRAELSGGADVEAGLDRPLCTVPLLCQCQVGAVAAWVQGRANPEARALGWT